jgi:hypothetical protein
MSLRRAESTSIPRPIRPPLHPAPFAAVVGGPRSLALGTALLLALAGCSSRPARTAYPGASATHIPKTPSVDRIIASSPRSSWIAAENRRPGTGSWRIRNPERRTGIEGYADHVSARSGDEVTLRISTQAAHFRVYGYRMGYYHGLGARLVWTSRRLPGKVQRSVAVDPKTNMVEARWKPSLSFPITSRWPAGDYLLKLVGSNRARSYIPLTIRDDSSHAAVVIMNAVTTWQAYNTWGGHSLYHGPPPLDSFDERARVVSFDRPYDSGEGAAGFLNNELPLVALAEKRGVDLTYWTDNDFSLRPRLLLHHRALVSLGHDEYWSASMRAGAIRARNRGVNIAFLGANADFRHIRLAPSPLGKAREVICYKVAAEDPLYDVKSSKVTADWREPPDPRPESVLNGDLYECNPVEADAVIVDASSWVFRGTGLKNRNHIHDLVYGEYDRVQRYYPTPETIQLLTHSPVNCRGQPSYADVTYYTLPKGAGVLDTGTSAWVPELGLRCVLRHNCDRRSRLLVTMTSNILKAFATGPAGLKHPSRPNLGKLGIELVAPIEFQRRAARRPSGSGS